MKDIKGYEGLYAITEDGKVWSYKSNQWMTPWFFGDYLYIGLQDKSYAVHRLVAQTYLDNPNNLPCVNHKDEDKTNNAVTNLEWCTYQYNNNYGTKGQRISAAMTSYWADSTHRKMASDMAKAHWADTDKRQLQSEKLSAYSASTTGKENRSKAGKSGWTPERKAKQAERMRAIAMKRGTTNG